MTSKLITRLAGRTAVIQLRPSGVGPNVWTGELRHDHHRPSSEVVSGAADVNGLQQVLERLSIRARIAAVPLDEES